MERLRYQTYLSFAGAETIEKDIEAHIVHLFNDMAHGLVEKIITTGDPHDVAKRWERDVSIRLASLDFHGTSMGGYTRLVLEADIEI
jgi:hypothetical protein